MAKKRDFRLGIEFFEDSEAPREKIAASLEQISAKAYPIVWILHRSGSIGPHWIILHDEPGLTWRTYD